MKVPLAVIWAAIGVDGFLLISFTTLVVASRALRLKRERTAARRLAPLRPLLLEVASEDDPQAGSLRRLQSLGPDDWEALVPAAAGLLGKLRGSSKQQIASLLDAHGSTARAYGDLFARRATRRARAAEMIGSLGHEELAPRLLRLLEDKRHDVRLVAARALGQLRSADASAGLIAAAGERSPIPRGVLGHALLRIGHRAVPELTRALSSPDWRRRSLAADLLGRLGALSAAEQLAGLASDDPALSVRVGAVEALGRFGLPEWLGPLAGAAGRKNPSRLREAAVEALSGVATPEAVSVLGSLTGDGDIRVGAKAAVSLASLGPLGRAALERVLSADLDDEEKARAAAQARGALALVAAGGR